MHLPAERLFRLLRRANPNELPPETLKRLEDISKKYEPCQKIQPAPSCFRVSFGAAGCRFNERILMDIMYLEGKLVLHIVDEGTRFSAARFIPSVSTKTIWQTFLTCWVAIYTGLPHKILVDHGTAFGRMFKTLGNLREVQIQSRGTEAHSSLGLVPSALVFKEYPSVRKISEPLQERPTLSSRAEMAMDARKEMSRIMAKKRIERGLKHNTPS
eukprot:IDg18868t1